MRLFLILISVNYVISALVYDPSNQLMNYFSLKIFSSFQIFIHLKMFCLNIQN
jgi:hypothetical protein